MIEAYRLLVERMDAEDMHYPLHLGVTEAGDGEDGRIKGAIGIGSLLFDGLGDTIRVSLTEDSVYEIPVARALADKAMSLWRDAPTEGPGVDSIDPYHFLRRETAALGLGTAQVGPEQPPRVIVRAQGPAQVAAAITELASPRLKETQAEGLLVPIRGEADLDLLGRELKGAAYPGGFLILELAESVPSSAVRSFLAASGRRTGILRSFSAGDQAFLVEWIDMARGVGGVLVVDAAPFAVAALRETIRSKGDEGLIFTYSGMAVPDAGHSVGAYRLIAEALRAAGSRAPIWIRNTAETAARGDNSFLSRLIEASVLTGSLLCDGLGDLVSFETEPDPSRAARVAYNLLQGAGSRISKAEFVACPSCGRTLFDLQTTTQRIRSQTAHLKGVKIAIMGCIVNGPGEMADADFGYVGGAPGKINLYVGKQCVQYNIPQAEADARLIALIKEHKKWAEPEPAHA
jgi:(E)-4-hydroxy-3-methylbut-2-enyl-diphosphate synthase